MQKGGSTGVKDRRSVRNAKRSSTATAEKGPTIRQGKQRAAGEHAEGEMALASVTTSSRLEANSSKALAEKVKRKSATGRRAPNDDALKLAANVGARREAACNFRKAFARRDDGTGPIPTLATLVGAQAGRAAEPRLKIVLTLLYLAREGDSWTVENVPAATWALLLGLNDPVGLGAARVGSAIRALHNSGVIQADQRRGREPRLRVLHEARNAKWTSPVGKSNEKQHPENRYAQLDQGFWSNGWITVLSARAVASLVVLLDATWLQKGTDMSPVQVRDDLVVDKAMALRWWHLTEEQLSEQYAISRDLFDRGVKELEAWGLVESKKRQAVERTSWGERRWYRELRVRLEVLRSPVNDVYGGKQVPRVAHSSEMPSIELVMPRSSRLKSKPDHSPSADGTTTTLKTKPKSN